MGASCVQVGGKTKNPVNRPPSTELKTTCSSLIVKETKHGEYIFSFFCAPIGLFEEHLLILPQNV